jgi:hypothetical protein
VQYSSIGTSEKGMDTTFMDGVVGSRVAALNIRQWLARVVGVRAAQGGLCAVFVDTVRI